MVGQVAIRQALRWEFRLTYADVAWLTGVSERTAWNHCNATLSSKLRHWLNRPEAERELAIEKAEDLVEDFLDKAILLDFAPGYWSERLYKVLWQ